MIISICSFKGGVAKTTTAVHLAFLLADRGKVLLVDGDPNRSATGWFRRGSFPFQVCDLMAAAKFSRNADYTVLDTQARPDAEEMKAIASGCDLLILPSSPDALSVEALYETTNKLASLDNCKVLLTLCDVRKMAYIDKVCEGIKQKGLPVFDTRIRLYTAYQKAALLGVPVYESGDNYGKIAWKDYKELGKEILGNG
ncbi:MAG: ParA family protein [Acaryochloris sp. CRU_2_0]|nr:ParA family protein [Acaryochloris sp. CRU_2_0]